MKDQKEIYEALILGKTLLHTPTGDMVKIINGMQATKTGETWDESQGSWTFEGPRDWEIVKEKEIYTFDCRWHEYSDDVVTFVIPFTPENIQNLLKDKQTRVTVEVIE